MLPNTVIIFGLLAAMNQPEERRLQYVSGKHFTLKQTIFT
jgi:hypothetical protein